MSHPEPFSSWKETVSSAFPHLSRSQATVLALWSYGMVLAKACGIALVSAVLALQLGWKEASLVQRLREWCYAAPDKKEEHRREVDVCTCFAPLLRWLLSWWPAEEPRLALALDATTLSDRFTVLAISVLYRGCAIPVAWKVVAAGAKGAWQPHWKDLLIALHDGVPHEWLVLVMADRGLYAPWLYEQIVALGWHPFLRINQQGHFRPVQVDTFRPLSTLLPKVGSAWCGEVVCFSQPKSRLRCTLLAQSEEGSAEGWLLLTDLSLTAAEVAWYAMRSWIEGGFKDTKRGGWQWHQTKMTDPARAERLWLALAVATVWVVSVGGEVDANVPVSSLSETHVARRNASGRTHPPTLVGLFCAWPPGHRWRIDPQGWTPLWAVSSRTLACLSACSPQGDEEVQRGYGQVGDDFVKKPTIESGRGVEWCGDACVAPPWDQHHLFLQARISPDNSCNHLQTTHHQSKNLALISFVML